MITLAIYPEIPRLPTTPMGVTLDPVFLLISKTSAHFKKSYDFQGTHISFPVKLLKDSSLSFCLEFA